MECAITCNSQKDAGTLKLRIVVDFKKLNSLTISDSFPLSNRTDILDHLENAKYFTTLDLASSSQSPNSHDWG